MWRGDLSTDSRRVVVGSAGYNYYWDASHNGTTNANMSASYRPTSWLSVTFNPSWTNSDALQYVTTVSDPTATAFFGSRYVMSALQEKVLALDTRFSVTFTPTMTFEFYAQPFFATGHYLNFMEYSAPRTNNFTVYGQGRSTISATPGTNGVVSSYTVDPDGIGPAAPFTFANPDFDSRSLRGNAVFRWEYHPGSVLYLAWTQSRSDVQPYGNFDFARDRAGLLATRPDNVFLVKVSWWIPR